MQKWFPTWGKQDTPRNTRNTRKNGVRPTTDDADFTDRAGWESSGREFSAARKPAKFAKHTKWGGWSGGEQEITEEAEKKPICGLFDLSELQVAAPLIKPPKDGAQLLSGETWFAARQI